MKPRANGRQRISAARLPLNGDPRRNGRKSAGGQRNRYSCSLERNQAGKIGGRIRAQFARRSWSLSVYFVSATFDQAMRKLEHTLRFLQRSEERLWFWGIDRSDDPNFSADLLGKEGLKLDRRAEFPEHSGTILLAPDSPVIANQLEPVRRDFSRSREMTRAASA